jgi:DNA polymerase-4
MPKPIKIIWGVGTATQAHLEKAGIRTIADLRRWEQADLTARFGQMGARLYHLARGQDRRRVQREAAVKSISKETTFFEDTADLDLLDGHIWRLATQVSDAAKAKGFGGKTVTLKLKRSDFSALSRRVTLEDPTQLADRIYRTARALFDAAQAQMGAGFGPFRLIGVGISDLSPAEAADLLGDLLDQSAPKRAAAERASDAIRARFGKDAIVKGRALR